MNNHRKTYTENDFKLYTLLDELQRRENGDKTLYEQAGLDLLAFLKQFMSDELAKMMETIKQLNKDVSSGKVVMMCEAKAPKTKKTENDDPTYSHVQ